MKSSVRYTLRPRTRTAQRTHRIPDLELDLFVVCLDHARTELNPDGEVVYRLEALVGELKQEA